MATRRRRTPDRFRLEGSLWITVGDRSLGGHGRVALLRAVAEHGSITQAAKAFGMSYKAAWDAIDAMNARAGTPLVERTTGGRGGGSTQLTERGRRLVERYEQVDAVHRRFLRLLADEAMDLDQEFSLLKVLNVKTSARNQWLGTVTAVRAGAVNDEIEVTLPGGLRLAAIVTRGSTESLDLKTQQTVFVLVKSPAVMLATGLVGTKLSARNLIPATVRQVTPGAVNAEVRLEAAGGLAINAIVTQDTIADLQLAPGAEVTAIVAASDIILAVAT